MKKPILISSFALLGTFALAADPDPVRKPETNSSSSQIHVEVRAQPAPNAGTTTAPKVTGKATITIEVNGQKQTREIDLGAGTLNAGTLELGGQPSSGGATTIHSGTSGLTFTSSSDVKVKTSAGRRTWLGVATDEPSDEVRAQLPLAEGSGLLIRSVVADSPAAKGGLLQNDILVRLDDQLLTNPDQLRKLVGMKKEGDTVRLAYLRKGREATAEITLGIHEGEDMNDLGRLLGDTVITGVLNSVKPLVFQGGLTLQNSLKELTEKSTAEVDGSLKQFEKALREAGVKDEVIEQARKSVEETAAALQKAANDINASKGDVAREVQKAVDEARKAVEKARHAAEDARKSAPTPPVEKAP